MKKTFKAFALMLLTALAFSSCVDVPVPYNLPDKGSGSGGNGGSTVDEGIAATCAQAVELTKALADGATSTETYTITGYITEVVGDVSRNQQTFWMADTKNGGRIFEAYWANLPEGVTAFTVGTKVKITGKLMKYVSNAGNVTPEMKNAIVTILEDGDTPPVEDGISVTCAKAVELTNALADNGISTETYTVTGYITEVVGSVSKNQQTFWMADTKDGGKVFEAYWANLPEGVTEFKVGMKVKITGQLLKYVKGTNITPEIKNASVVVLEDDGSGGTNPPVEGTEITCAQAVELTNALADGGISSETYTITGYITEVFGSVSRNQQSFWMADTKDGGNVFEAYWANLPEGVSEFKVGMKVKITGNLLKYVKDGNVTPEIKNANVVILEMGDGGTTPVDESALIDFTKGQGSWRVESVSGPEVWTNSSQYGEVASGFDNDNKVCQTAEGWLISPEIDLTNSSNSQIVLNEAVNKIAAGSSVDIQCQVLACISDNQTSDGWQLLTADKRPAGNSWTFQDDTFDASAFDGKKILLAFKYVSTEASAPSWEIKTVKIKGGGQSGGGGDIPGPGGETLADLVNGSFESWESDTELLGWKPSGSSSGPGNAVYSQNRDSHEGAFSCFIAANGSTNMRLSTQELTLSAGTYTFSYYAKAVSANPTQTRCGYVPVTNGTVGTYNYSGYFDLNDSEWSFVSYEFTLEAETVVCLFITNPKNNTKTNYVAQDILVDDATLIKK